MDLITTFAWIILTFICLILAPFMTIGIIFIGAGWKILGYIFIIIGIIHAFSKLSNN